MFEQYLDPTPDAAATLPWRTARPSLGRFADGADALDDVPALVANLAVDASVAPVAGLYPGGERAAAPAAGAANVASFVEELLVRRELAVNHAVRNPDYDRYAGLPAWARRTLEAHAGDPRPARYDDATLEAGASDDPYWNAAMQQSVATGYQHNHMRMYWGKMLEWSDTPE